MDLLELLQTITREVYDASQPTDLQIGTVVKAPPDDELEIRISEAMASLKSTVLYLAEPVIEKKLPLLKHRHKFPHTHVGVHGPTQPPTPSEYTEYSTLSEASSGDVQTEDIKGLEDGKVLPLSKDGKYIILNRALEVGDKVLLLRVQGGQKFIVLSRVFGGDN
nr:MAG TPA: Protein of unknown function (DUF2577) [Caudoviricetes sp.]